MRRLLHSCMGDAASSKVVPERPGGAEKADAVTSNASAVPGGDRELGHLVDFARSSCSRDVFQIHSDTAQVAFTACVCPCNRPGNPVAAPKVVCRVFGASHASGGALHGPSTSVPLPRDTQWAASGPSRQKQAAGGWHAHVLAADAAALSAWGVPDRACLARALSALAAQDVVFSNTLSCVAFSIAAPLGASSSSSIPSSEYRPKGLHTQPGWTSLTVSSCYVRDTDDGTLQPCIALFLEVRGPSLRHIPLAPIPGLEPRGAAAGAKGQAVTLFGSTGGSAKLSGRAQRKLLRAGAALSASPYISTFLELELPPAPAPAAASRAHELSFAPSTRGSPTDAGADAGWSSLDWQQGPVLGRILLQNEGSLSYWGKLTARNRTGSWQLLVELLQDIPNALEELRQHLREQRGATSELGPIPSSSSSPAVDDWPLGLMAGAPWKKVVSVPSHNRVFAKVLANQLAPVQKQGVAKDASTAMASWLTGGPGAASGAAGTMPPLKPVHAPAPTPMGMGGDAAVSGGSPVTPPSRGSPSQRGALGSQAQSRSPIPEDSGLMSVTPSRQMMSMMAAVANGSPMQASMNQRRMMRNTSLNGLANSPSSAKAEAAAMKPVRFGPGGMKPGQSSSDKGFARMSAPVRSSTTDGQPEPSFAGFLKGGDGSIRDGRLFGSGNASAPGGPVAGEASMTFGTADASAVGADSDSDFGDSAQDLHAIEEEEDCEEMLRYHEVQVIPIIDPVTHREAVLLIQTDITSRALMEQRIAALTESQLRMLERMFPRHVLEFVMGTTASLEHLGSLAYQHQQATILFMDVVGFTSMSKEVAPDKVMEFLNLLFSKFDNDLDKYDCYKVETAGDCYIVAGALMRYDEEGFVTLDVTPDGRRGARNVLSFAQAMLRHARTVTMPHNGQPTQVRIGIHTGGVTSGLIGTRLPKFGLFGDTMNTSSRMESTGRPGCVQVSEAMFGMLAPEDQAMFQPSGGIEVKGKGLMPTFVWTPTEEDLKPRPDELPTAASEPPGSPSPEPSEERSASDWPPPREDGAATAASALFANGLVGRAKSTVVHSTNSAKRAQWNLVRSVVKVVATKEQESKVQLVRSRLSRIATGAKSSPALGFDPTAVMTELSSWASGGAAGPVGAGAAAAGGGGVGGAATPRPMSFVSKQSSMMLMKEMMQLMKATVDE